MAICWSTELCYPPEPQADAEAVERDTLVYLGSYLEAGNLTAENRREWLIRTMLADTITGSEFFSNYDELNRVLIRWNGLTLNTRKRPRSAWLADRVAGVVEQMESAADELLAEEEASLPLFAAARAARLAHNRNT